MSALNQACQVSDLSQKVKNLNIETATTKDADGHFNASSASQQSAQQWTPNNSLPLETYLPKQKTPKDEVLTKTICKNLKSYGICILNDFLRKDQAEEVYKDILKLYEKRSLFIDGEVLKQGSAVGSDRVRGDRITWVDQSYTQCPALKLLCLKMDKLLDMSCKQLGFVVETRTKPMVACYPGDGARYRQHIDNPAGDGRLFTFLYYLNKNWDPEVDGGSLCLYPQGKMKLKCEPVFNRACIFFSDSRNPHEVFPCYRERFAVTCWYFEQEERRRALEKWKEGSKKKEESKEKKT